jgi:hypothetical protein
MREANVLEKVDWDEFMASEAKRFDQQVQACKMQNTPCKIEDGHMRERFEQYSSGCAPVQL